MFPDDDVIAHLSSLMTYFSTIQLYSDLQSQESHIQNCFWPDGTFSLLPSSTVNTISFLIDNGRAPEFIYGYFVAIERFEQTLARCQSNRMSVGFDFDGRL